MSAMAEAGTSLARCAPNRSVYEIMKYRMPFVWAKLARSCGQGRLPGGRCNRGIRNTPSTLTLTPNPSLVERGWG